MKIYNLEDYPLSIKNASYGGTAGNKDGIIVEGQEWLIKYPKKILDSDKTGHASYSTSPLSEYLGSYVFQRLGFSVHSTNLGIRNNKLVVACKDFVANAMLLETRTIKNHTGKELSTLLDRSPISSTESHISDLDELLLHIRKNPVLKEIDGLEVHFFKQAIVDILIANTDRNYGNWGIIREKGKEDQIAPVYDNGASFSPNSSDEQVIRLFNNKHFEENSLKVLIAYRKDHHLLSAYEFLEEVKDIQAFQTAIKEITPAIEESLDDIHALINDIPKSCMTQNGVIPVCSDERKNLYNKQLNLHFQKIIEPAYERLIS